MTESHLNSCLDYIKSLTFGKPCQISLETMQEYNT